MSIPVTQRLWISLLAQSRALPSPLLELKDLAAPDLARTVSHNFGQILADLDVQGVEEIVNQLSFAG